MVPRHSRRRTSRRAADACIACREDAAFLRGKRPPYERLPDPVRVVDLFAGCGGLSLGIAEAARRTGRGISIRLAVDVDKEALNVFEANFPGAQVRLDAVEKIFNGKLGKPPTAVERKVRRSVGVVDVLVGGPPCQGHSDLNNHTRRADPRNRLYARMARAAEILRPTIILIENVPMIANDVKKVLDLTKNALRTHYELAEDVIDLTRLGVPQRRRRHVILGIRRPGAGPSGLLALLEQRCGLHAPRSVRWAIYDLARQASLGPFDSAGAASPQNARRIKWLFENGAYNLPNRQRPLCHRSGHSYVSMYGRLAWDAPAQTVTTGFGSMGQGRYVHPSKRRTITPHEAARLQMLPDFFDFGAARSRSAMARLIGNAVPPPLASAILERVLAVSKGRNRILGGVRDLPRANQKRVALSELGIGRASKRPSVPPPSSEATGHRMRSTRRSDTAAEQALFLELNRLGLDYDIDRAPLVGVPRRADALFEKARLAVYVDGCFWHGCPDHGTWPKANAAFWRGKIEDNRERDINTLERLTDAGWTVLRFWEHDDPVTAAGSVARALSARTVLAGGRPDDARR
jgi:DNA (cytosine-5)-methyltransferase 1